MRTQKTIGHIQTSPAIFVDRDGTICEEVNYLRRVEDLHLLPFAAEALRLARQAGYRVVIISNQSGVARGYMEESTVQEINQALQEMLREQGAEVDGIYYCPHHIQGNPPYNIDCPCRKPNPGMLYRAQEDLHLDLAHSVVIGDKYSDVETAHRVNIPGILVLTGYGREEKERIAQQHLPPPEYIASDLQDAVRWWLEHEHRI